MTLGKKILIILTVLIFLVGVGFLLFPPVSNFIGQKQADSVADRYDEAVENVAESVTTESGEVIDSLEKAQELGYVDDEGYPVESVTTNADGSYTYGSRVVYQLDLDRLKADSIAYNKRLITGQGNADTIQYDRSVFDLRKYGLDDGVYGYISAWTIGLRLPIYLGASDEMMSYGGGHLYGTSLPVGDEDSNVAIAGHTGYIGRIFFDNIRNLQLGHEVKLITWWGEDTYRVIDYKAIRADDSSDLMIRKGRHLLTLITCTYDPNGVKERYVVICEKES